MQNLDLVNAETLWSRIEKGPKDKLIKALSSTKRITQDIAFRRLGEIAIAFSFLIYCGSIFYFQHIHAKVLVGDLILILAGAASFWIAKQCSAFRAELEKKNAAPIASPELPKAPQPIKDTLPPTLSNNLTPQVKKIDPVVEPPKPALEPLKTITRHLPKYSDKALRTPLNHPAQPPKVVFKPVVKARSVKALGKSDEGLFNEWNLKFLSIDGKTEEFLNDQPKLFYILEGHGGIYVEQEFDDILHGPITQSDALIVTTEGRNEYEVKIKTGPHSMKILIQEHPDHKLKKLFAAFAISSFSKGKVESSEGIKKGILIDASAKINFLQTDAPFNPMNTFPFRWLEIHLEAGAKFGEWAKEPAFLYVLEGKGFLDLKEVSYSFNPGDYSRIPADFYSIRNHGKELLKLLLI